VLNHASFYKLKLKNTRFSHCKLEEVDFSECDLSAAVFDECELTGATFDQTNLEKADFRTAVRYVINPTTNRIKKAKFSLRGVAGLLTQFDIIIE
jgi:uncharacterized protein YjbI with pentapeptide repeats